MDAELEPVEIPIVLARELLQLPTGSMDCESVLLKTGETEIYISTGDGAWHYIGSLWGDAWLESY